MNRLYVRVSTSEQNTARQYDALKDFGLTIKDVIIYEDKMSGKDTNRPQLQAMLNDLQEGDTVYTKSLDRLGRNSLDLVEMVNVIEKKKATLRTLDRKIDTANDTNKIIIYVLSVVAEMERKNIKERTKEGIAIAKNAGKYKGRKQGAIKIKDAELKQFIKDYNTGINKNRLSQIYNVQRSTIYNWIRILKEQGKIK